MKLKFCGILLFAVALQAAGIDPNPVVSPLNLSGVTADFPFILNESFSSTA